MIRNVSLGHGLFDLINKEKQLKVSLDHHLIVVLSLNEMYLILIPLFTILLTSH